MARKSTNIVQGTTYAIERNAAAICYTTATGAWDTAIKYNNERHHDVKIFDNCGWVKGLRQTDDGNWGGYIWAMQNTVNFKTSATNVWVSQNGVTNVISKVLVETIGDYAPMQTVEDTGPTLEGLTDNPPTGGSSNDVVYTADFTAYYDIGLPALWIQPLLTNVCINSSNVIFTLIKNSYVANVNWSITPQGLSNGAVLTGYASNAVVAVGGVATSYVVKATANDNTNIYALAVLNVVKVDIVSVDATSDIGPTKINYRVTPAGVSIPSVTFTAPGITETRANVSGDIFFTYNQSDLPYGASTIRLSYLGCKDMTPVFRTTFRASEY